MIPIGSLIITKLTPSSVFFGSHKGQYFFDEKTGNCSLIEVGTCGLIVDNSRLSAIGNKVIDVLFFEHILSIADYVDQYGNNVWCDVVSEPTILSGAF